MITDMIDREIQVDDFVVFYNSIYRVKSLGKEYPANSRRGVVKIMIWNDGKTSKPVTKHCKDMAVLDPNQVMVWLLKQG